VGNTFWELDVDVEIFADHCIFLVSEGNLRNSEHNSLKFAGFDDFSNILTIIGFFSKENNWPKHGFWLGLNNSFDGIKLNFFSLLVIEDLDLG